MKTINITIEEPDESTGADLIQDAVLGVIMGKNIKLNKYECSSKIKLFEPPEMVELKIPSFVKNM